MPIFALLALLYPAVASAQSPPQYHVEIVVFEHLSASNDGEVWQETTTVPDWSNAVRIDSDSGYRQVSGRHLAGVQAAMRQSAYYRPLVYKTWQQPGLTPSRARPVLLPTEEEKVQGTVTIRSSNLLHVDLDLYYSTGDGFGNNIQLQESRRIKLNEMHYFDHPLYGAIVRVSRAGD
ncbi:MAG: CsiV family protein [Gammaproteobacteria bacterium]